LNEAFPEIKPVEVILLSRNSHETGQRVFRSISHYNLGIHKAAFFRGESPHKYIPAFGASLFLSANEDDVRNAINAGFPAGRVVKTEIKDEENDKTLRIAFDFDGVAIGDEAEQVYDKEGLLGFYFSEMANSEKTHNPGPINNFVKQLMALRGMESEKEKQDQNYQRILDLAFITARDAPAHERMINTIKSWGGEIDKSFFLGGTPKKNILEILSPHIYFDDQERHFDDVHNIPLVHIPFGIRNVKK
ncbi:MAG: 5'-nucleotidase, partial [Patescibacteria group bacterium]